MPRDHKSEDEILGKAYDAKLMKRLLGYVKPYKKYVILAIALNIGVSALGPLRPFLTKFAVDNSIANKDYSELIIISAMLLATLLAQAVIQYYLTYYTQYMGQKIMFDIRTRLFAHIQKLSMKFFDKTPIGRLVTRVTNDVESLNELFSSGLVMSFSDIFTIIWIFGFMFYMDFTLSMIALSTFPVLFYGAFLFRRKAREAYRDVRLHLARLNSYMQEKISGISVIQLFNKEKEELKQFSEINNDYKAANIKSIFYYAVFYPSIEFLSAVTLALIIWYGGGEVISGTLTLGVLIAFFQYTEMFFRPIRDLSEKYNIMQTAMASSERIFKLLDNDAIIKNPENPVKISDVKGEIEFKDVWFAYEDESYVLKNISFKINPGETVAIVGATGAGKTSIINILTRFYDINKGAIYLDGIDIRKFDKRDLRKYISIVLQDVFIFSGDIKNNISLGNPETTDEKIAEAAKLVGADKFISALSSKYDEEVKERGATLSVGQKQLLSFARAIAYNPQILILDEATSSIDAETEALIQNAIKRLLTGRTSIVIAHRLSTIQNASKIIVLHKGEIREMGNHRELLAKRGVYYKLYQLQYKSQNADSI